MLCATPGWMITEICPSGVLLVLLTETRLY